MVSTGRRQPVSPPRANEAPISPITVRRVIAPGGSDEPAGNSLFSSGVRVTAGESSSRSRLRQ